MNATIIVHPRSLSDRAVATALDRAIANMKFGTVGVNLWAAAAYGSGVTSWGAFPGHTPDDVQSGIGIVHNTLMFDHAQKSVMRAPFRGRTPPWFATRGRAGAKFFSRMVQFMASPSLWKLPDILIAVMRG